MQTTNHGVGKQALVCKVAVCSSLALTVRDRLDLQLLKNGRKWPGKGAIGGAETNRYHGLAAFRYLAISIEPDNRI